MNRQEFLEKLRLLLGDLSEEEREEAMQMQDRRWKNRLSGSLEARRRSP